MRTLNNIVTELRTYSRKHKQINSFTFAVSPDKEPTEAPLYPELACTIVSADIGENQESLDFDFLILDQPSDKDNQEQAAEVLSDTKQIANDTIAYCKYQFEEGNIDLPVQMDAVFDYGEDGSYGWKFRLKFKLNQGLDLCSAPISDGPSLSTLLDGLVASYSLDENLLSAVNGHHGIDHNITYSPGKINQGIYINANSYFEVPGKSTLSFIQNTLKFSISFWIKPNDFSQSFLLMGNAASSLDKGFYVSWDGSPKRLSIYIARGVNSSPALQIQSATDFFTDNDWVHVVIGNDIDSAFKIYKNGASFLSFISPPLLGADGDSSATCFVGAVNYDPIFNDFIGSLDCLNFHNRLLLQEEVTELYNNGIGKQHDFYFDSLGFKMSPLNANIAGMTPTDSGSVISIGDNKLGYFWGWEASSTYATNWWKSEDNGMTWEQQGVLPFASAHVTQALRDDGLIWFWGIITLGADAGKWFVCTFDPQAETFTTVSIGVLPGEDAQWGVYHMDELYLARFVGPLDVDLYKWNGVDDFEKHSDLPAANFYRSAAYSDGTVVRLTGGGLFDIDGTTTIGLVDKVYQSTDLITFTQPIDLPEQMQALWPSLTSLSGKMIYIQGFRSQPRNDGHIYIFENQAWEEIEEWSWLDGRHAVATGYDSNGDIVCMNGYLNADCFKIRKRQTT